MPADGLELTLEISSNVPSFTASPIVFRLRSLEDPVVPLHLYHFSAAPFKRAKHRCASPISAMPGSASFQISRNSWYC